jgi:predicted RNase H-like HicB family nuclease
MTMTHNVSIVIEKDDDGYYAYSPELDGCQTQGDTVDAVLATIHQAVERFLVFFAQCLLKALPVADKRFEHGPVCRDGSAHFNRDTYIYLLCKVLSSSPSSSSLHFHSDSLHRRHYPVERPFCSDQILKI